MNTKLFFQALIKFLLGVIVFGLLIFLPAGSFQYWQGWLMMWVLFLPILFSGISMLLNNPELRRKRLIMLLHIPHIAKRIRHEEAVLEQGLKGYSEYKQRVKYKVLPFIW